MKLTQKRKLIGIGLALPFLCGFVFFYLVPFFISVYYTFTFGTGQVKKDIERHISPITQNVTSRLFFVFRKLLAKKILLIQLRNLNFQSLS